MPRSSLFKKAATSTANESSTCDFVVRKQQSKLFSYSNKEAEDTVVEEGGMHKGRLASVLA